MNLRRLYFSETKLIRTKARAMAKKNYLCMGAVYEKQTTIVIESLSNNNDTKQ